MQLRYRHFLLVGGLFFFCFIAAVYAEAFLTKRLLKAAEKQLFHKLEQEHAEKSHQMQEFLKGILAAGQVRINATLENFSIYPNASSIFEPQAPGSGTWPAAGRFLFENKWIDFFQNTSNGQLNSLLLVQKNALQEIQISQADEFSLVQINGSSPLIGIPIPLGLSGLPYIPKKENKLNFYLLFSSDQLSALRQIDLTSTNDQGAANASSQEDIQYLLQTLQNRLRKLADRANPNFEFFSSESTGHPQKKKEDIFKTSMEALTERYDQTFLIRFLSNLFQPGLFGVNPEGTIAPKGIAFSVDDHPEDSKALLTSSCLLNAPLFDDRGYLAQATDQDINERFALIQPNDHTLFLGNTIRLAGQGSSDLVTIGSDIEVAVQLLSKAVQMPAFVYSKKRIFYHTQPFTSSEVCTALDLASRESQGTLSIEGKSYFFMQMQPLPTIDLHFFVMNLAEKEFETINSLSKSTQKVIEQVTHQMWIIAFFALVVVLSLLNQLSRRITQPIVQLAAAADAVRTGKFNEATLPPLEKKRPDEIASLYSAFQEMVQALVDKEKVRAVLNKVVSSKIAAEILRTGMKLGGEKKKVCVLFADIRGFTSITEKMPPEEVIGILNLCMTRISAIIDRLGGVIDKYVGDEVMALFGIPEHREDSTKSALQAAIEIIDSIEQWNQERMAKGLVQVYMGIGLDVGEVIAGNMGAENRQNYTVLGHHVNLAARLCSAAAPGQILVSSAILAEPGVREMVQAHPLPPTALKGLSQTVEIYQLTLRTQEPL